MVNKACKPVLILSYLPTVPTEQPTLYIKWLGFPESTKLFSYVPTLYLLCPLPGELLFLLRDPLQIPPALWRVPQLRLLQNCCSFLCAPEMLWIQPVRQHVDQEFNDLQFNDLFPYLPSHWAGRATRSKTHILLPWTYTGLEKQFIKFLKLEEGPAVGAGCRREAVKGWTFKTLGLVTADLNLCWTQSASEKHFHHKALFPPRFLNTSPYQFESCSLFLSQKEFPFKQKLFRHFQDMKC